MHDYEAQTRSENNRLAAPRGAAPSTQETNRTEGKTNRALHSAPSKPALNIQSGRRELLHLQSSHSHPARLRGRLKGGRGAGAVKLTRQV